MKPALANTPDSPVVNPTRSANRRGNTIPACATVPAPPTSTDKPCDHPSAGSTPAQRLLVLFTSKVFLSRVLQISTIRIVPGQEHLSTSQHPQNPSPPPCGEYPRLVGLLAGGVGGLGAAWFGAEHFDQFRGPAGATGPTGQPGPRGPQGDAAPQLTGGMIRVSEFTSCPAGTQSWGFDRLEYEGGSYSLCTIG